MDGAPQFAWKVNRSPKSLFCLFSHFHLSFFSPEAISVFQFWPEATLHSTGFATFLRKMRKGKKAKIFPKITHEGGFTKSQ